MNLLLDTCVFLWMIWDDPVLTPDLRGVLADPRNELFLSAVSVWEASHKHALGKLTVHAPEGAWAHFTRQRAAHGIRALPFDDAAVRHLSALPPVHRDPFDRMLICQAIEHSLTVVTPDAHIRRYPIKTFW